jgi:hypothetical protein
MPAGQTPDSWPRACRSESCNAIWHASMVTTRRRRACNSRDRHRSMSAATSPLRKRCITARRTCCSFCQYRQAKRQNTTAFANCRVTWPTLPQVELAEALLHAPARLSPNVPCHVCSGVPVPLAVGHGPIFLRFLGDQSLVSGKDADTGYSHRGWRDFGQRSGCAQAEGEDQIDSTHLRTFPVEAPMPGARAPSQSEMSGSATPAQKPVKRVDSDAEDRRQTPVRLSDRKVKCATQSGRIPERTVQHSVALLRCF